jgi:hypothetical protein
LTTAHPPNAEYAAIVVESISIPAAPSASFFMVRSEW